jgi:hypothetical protein
MHNRLVIDTAAIGIRYDAVSPTLDEKGLRFFSASEALAAGRGGIVAVSAVTGIALANETGLSITVAHHPPGTSKWNRIEHRMFSFISINWRGRPLVSHQVVVQLIASTKTETGLNITCDIDWGRYPKGIKIPKAALKELNIKYDDFHGDWNYTISPITNQETGKSPSK